MPVTPRKGGFSPGPRSKIVVGTRKKAKEIIRAIHANRNKKKKEKRK